MLSADWAKRVKGHVTRFQDTTADEEQHDQSKEHDEYDKAPNNMEGR